MAPDILVANSAIATYNSNAVVGQAAFTPCFYPIDNDGVKQISFTNIQMRVRTAGTNTPTFGAAVYSWIPTGVGTFSATLVAQFNAVASGTSAVMVNTAVTTGASGSGAGTATLDFTQNRYIIGSMGSEVGTLALAGGAATTATQLQGVMRWSAAALASGTAWPASFTQTSVSAANASTSMWYAAFVTPTGAFYL
jgi:hypothetical protein